MIISFNQEMKEDLDICLFVHLDIRHHPFIDELVYQNCALLSDTIECFTPNAHFRLKDCLFYAVYHVVEV